MDWKELAPDRRRRRKIHGESCKDVILELSRLATGPLEHLVEINSLNAYLCDRHPWFHGPLALCNDGFKLSVFLVGFQLLALIDTLSDIALVCSVLTCLWLYHYACGRVAHLTLLTVQNKVHM